MLMSVVQMFNGDLRFAKAGQGIVHSNCIVRRSRWSGLASRAELGGALILHPIDAGIERANVGAQMLLIGNAAFQTVEIESNHVRARSGQGRSQRVEQEDSALEQIEKMVGVGSHGSSQFVQLMLLFLVGVGVQDWSGRNTRRGFEAHRPTRAAVIGDVPIAARQEVNGRRSRWTEVFHVALIRC